MAKKKNENTEIIFPALELLVGVDFVPLGGSEEKRIEPGVINLGVLPTAFQNELIERKNARIVNG